MLSRIKRHPVWSAVTASAITASAVVLIYFAPQQALINTHVDQPIPRNTAVGTPSTSATGHESNRTSLAGLEHDGSGQVLIVTLASGERYVRLENLNTSNGPDVHVILSPVAPGTDWYAYNHGYADLGSLQANMGNQNYTIPSDVDLAGYKSVVVWCKRFGVGFAVAPIPTP